MYQTYQKMNDHIPKRISLVHMKSTYKTKKYYEFTDLLN